MDHPAYIDRLTVISIAVIAYALSNMTHEIIGHCGTAALLGGKCSFISTTDVRLATEFPPWKFRLVAVAGSAANWLVALFSLWLLQRSDNHSPALRSFLWLSLCFNLFIPSTYLLASPLLRFGDWYNMTVSLRWQLGWGILMTMGGAAACYFSFRICRAELIKLIGSGGKSGSKTTWTLVWPAYLATGIVAILAATFGPLPARWAYFVAAGGTFGTTFWMLLLPQSLAHSSVSQERAFVIPRNIAWLAAGSLCALTFVLLLGRGVNLSR